MGSQPETVRNGGRLARDTAIYAAGNIAVRAGSFLLIPLQTHWLSLDGYGALMTLYATMQLLLIGMSFGMRDAFLRYEKTAQSSKSLGQLFGTSLVLTATGSAAVAAASYLFLTPFLRVMLGTNEVGGYIGVTNGAALSFALCLHVTTYYRANNQPIRYLLAGLAGVGLLLVSSILFIAVMHWGVYGAMLAYLVTYGAIAVAVIIDVVARTGIGFSVPMAAKLVRFGFPLVFAMFGKFVMSSSGIYFLNYYAGLETVAIYSLGMKFAQILDMVLLFPYQLAFAPYIFGRLDSPGIKQEMASHITSFVVLCAMLSFGLLFASRPLIALSAPDEYSAAFLVVILCLPAVQLKGLGIFGEVALSIVHRTGTVGYIIGGCAVVCVAMSVWLAPRIHWYGVITAATVSYGLCALALSFVGQRAYPLPIQWKPLLAALLIWLWFLAAFLLVWNAAPLTFALSAVAALGVAFGAAHVSHLAVARDLGALCGMVRGKMLGTTS